MSLHRAADTHLNKLPAWPRTTGAEYQSPGLPGFWCLASCCSRGGAVLPAPGHRWINRLSRRSAGQQ